MGRLRTAPGKGDPRAGSMGREEMLLRAVLEASEDLDPDLGVGTDTQVLLSGCSVASSCSSGCSNFLWFSVSIV